MPVERVNGSLVSSRLSVLKWPFFHTIFSYMDLLRLEKWFAVERRTIRPIGLHEDWHIDHTDQNWHANEVKVSSAHRSIYGPTPWNMISNAFPKCDRNLSTNPMHESQYWDKPAEKIVRLSTSHVLKGFPNMYLCLGYTCTLYQYLLYSKLEKRNCLFNTSQIISVASSLP